VLKIYTSFAAHVRYMRRANCIDRDQLERIVTTLRRGASGGVIFDQYPRLLATRSVTTIIPVETIRRVFQTQTGP